MTNQTEKTCLKSRPFGRWDYLKITILVFATTGLWQSMHTLILPIRILDFAAESEKNTYLGLMTFVGLIIAMLRSLFSGLSATVGLPHGEAPPLHHYRRLPYSFCPASGWQSMRRYLPFTA